jgi:segregation and condensation protein A
LGSETPDGAATGIAVHLEVFEGPLDLLLHLIREEKLDIHDIPIARITEQYLSYLEAMKALNLDLAGEFLVMAATLIYIKSKSLLPRTDEELEPEEDPEFMRAELSRRLIEYQKFKEAAARLSDRPILGRDVFARDFLGEEIPVDEIVVTELSMADLITAFKDVLERMPKDEAHQVFVDRLTIADAIAFLLTASGRTDRSGSTACRGVQDENEIISFFLGILELVRLRTVKVYQANPMGFITIVPAVREVENGKRSEEPDTR